MPDFKAIQVLDNYERGWAIQPSVFKIQDIKRNLSKPPQIKSEFRFMKISIPYYGKQYFFKPYTKCKEEFIQLVEGNFSFRLRENKECKSSMPEIIGEKIDFEKIPYCVFILSCENEIKFLNNEFSGLKTIPTRSESERNEVIKALIALQVKY
jgi:hypothetical protein